MLSRNGYEDGAAERARVRARLNELFDRAPIAYCTFSRDGLVTGANHAAMALLGIEKKHLVGQQFGFVLGPRARVAFLSHLKRCFVERTQVTSDFVLGRTRGPLALQIVSSLVYDEDGEPFECLSTLIDTSAGVRSEQMLRFLADASEVLVSSLDYRVTLAQTVHMAVPAVADLCFVDLLDGRVDLACSDEAVWPSYEALRHANGLAGRTAQSHVLHSGEGVVVPAAGAKHRLSCGDGHMVEASSYLLVPIGLRGRPLGVMTWAITCSTRQYGVTDLNVAQDVARRAAMAIENARLYGEAQRAVRMRDDVLAMVSHDLRNPLNAISLGADELLGDMPPGDRRKNRRQLEIFKRAAGRMERLVGDLLDLSSIEAGKLPMQVTEHAVDALLEDAVEQLSSYATSSGLRVELKKPSQTLYALCDRGRVLQVIGNLLSNALKHSPENGVVTLGAVAAGQSVRFSVEDNGPGIAPALLPRIFERYVKGHSTRGEGRGLGLYIAKRIVEELKGDMQVDSRVGHGSTFSFTLPRSYGFAGGSLQTVTAKPLEHVILLVEDEADNRQLLAHCLNERGYRVLEACNGLEALSVLQNGRSPDVIVLDLQMPVMDGWDFMRVRQENASYKSIPTLLLSGQDDLGAEAVRLGATGYVEKPLRIERLIAALQRAMP